MAFMLLHQDVATFNRFLRVNAPKVVQASAQVEAEEYLAAKMMGRWRDGTPLALSPQRPDPAAAMRDDFGYSDDPEGIRCPLAAHIRVANARDQPLNALNQSLFPGGFRVSYAAECRMSSTRGRRGRRVRSRIAGMFLCANLNSQFYTIMRWLGRTDFSPLFPDQVGQDRSSATGLFLALLRVWLSAGRRDIEDSHEGCRFRANPRCNPSAFAKSDYAARSNVEATPEGDLDCSHSDLIVDGACRSLLVGNLSSAPSFPWASLFAVAQRQSEVRRWPKRFRSGLKRSRVRDDESRPL